MILVHVHIIHFFRYRIDTVDKISFVGYKGKFGAMNEFLHKNNETQSLLR